MQICSWFEISHGTNIRTDKSCWTFIRSCQRDTPSCDIYIHGLVGREFVSGPGDLGSIPGRVIPKTLKMVLDTSLLNSQQYKVRIMGKVEQSRERSSALPYTSM